VNEWAIGGCWPDLVILLDVPAEQLARRMHRRELDRFERSGPEFYERVAEGFRLLAAEEPDRWVIVDGDRPMEEVAVAVRNAVRARLDL
jgi:dTMP kinase